MLFWVTLVLTFFYNKNVKNKKNKKYKRNNNFKNVKNLLNIYAAYALRKDSYHYKASLRLTVSVSHTACGRVCNGKVPFCPIND